MPSSPMPTSRAPASPSSWIKTPAPARGPTSPLPGTKPAACACMWTAKRPHAWTAVHPAPTAVRSITTPHSTSSASPAASCRRIRYKAATTFCAAAILTRSASTTACSMPTAPPHWRACKSPPPPSRPPRPRKAPPSCIASVGTTATRRPCWTHRSPASARWNSPTRATSSNGCGRPPTASPKPPGQASTTARVCPAVTITSSCPTGTPTSKAARHWTSLCRTSRSTASSCAAPPTARPPMSRPMHQRSRCSSASKAWCAAWTSSRHTVAARCALPIPRRKPLSRNSGPTTCNRVRCPKAARNSATPCAAISSPTTTTSPRCASTSPAATRRASARLWSRCPPRHRHASAPATRPQQARSSPSCTSWCRPAWATRRRTRH